jgi:hypothetical protein
MEHSPYPKLPGTDAFRSEAGRILPFAISGNNAATRRNSAAGKGTFKAIAWTAILVAFIYTTAMVLPILVNEYQFQDALQNIARFASVNRENSELIQKDVLTEAQKEDLPIKGADIKVESNAGNIRINVDYSVTVDLKVYQWTLNFHPNASNASLL